MKSSVSELDDVSQQMMANAMNSSSMAKEIRLQANDLSELVVSLSMLAFGKSGEDDSTVFLESSTGNSEGSEGAKQDETLL